MITSVAKIECKDYMKRYSPFIPYVAVLIGMYVFRSAFIAMGAYHAGMLVVLFFNRNKCQKLTKPQGASLLYLTAPVFASGGIIFYFIWPFIAAGNGIPEKLHEYGLTQNIWPIFAVYFVLINSAIEEFFWRGYLKDDSIKPNLNDFLFGGYHSLVLFAFTDPAWTILVLAAVTFAGWLWRFLRARTQSLVLPLLTHFLADLTIMWAVHMRVF